MATKDADLVVPRCTFCGGKGKAGERAEKVKDEMGHVYHVPVSHRECRDSVKHYALGLWGMAK